MQADIFFDQSRDEPFVNQRLDRIVNGFGAIAAEHESRFNQSRFVVPVRLHPH